MDDIRVIKRDGTQENFNIEKINKIIQWSIDGINNVSLSDIEINAKLNIRDKITTREIHTVLIDSAATLISLNTPDYQFVASRLLNYQLRKDIWGGKTPPTLFDFIEERVEEGIYDPQILEKYSKNEICKLGECLDHDRDLTYTYAGLQQLCDKYLLKNRSTKEIFETPQFAWMVLSMAGFINYPGKERLNIVKSFYNAYSKHKINLPTPIIAGVRGAKTKAYSSCMLIDVDDDRKSLTASNTAVSLATADRYGIGINMGRIRCSGAQIKQGEVVHPGPIPFLKTFESSVRAWLQGGLRGGSASVNFPIWHYDIEDILVLKNNAGTDDSRVRKLDYTIACSKLFYERLQKNENITLFCPHECKVLYEKFGQPDFDEYYIKCESNTKLKHKKVVSAKNLFRLLIKERTETGRIYLLNIDSGNAYSAWDIPVRMTNLCTEILHPVKPIYDFNDPEGEIGVCILSAINLLEIKSDLELEKVCDLIVRFLEEIIDNQIYFNPAAKKFATERRSLGIGITNLAAVLAKSGLKYSDNSALDYIDERMETIQFFLLKSSNNLAKERGKCKAFGDTKYARGLLPIDHYKKTVDNLVKRPLTRDWDSLRKNIEEYGLRHSTLTAQMPCESSSVVQCSTNGTEPIRSLLTYKISKAGGQLPVVAPGAGKWDKNYEFAFDLQDNTGIINVNAVIQKWLDMSTSTNIYYNYSHYINNLLPDSKILKEILYAYSMGLISLYYSNTHDGDKEQSLEEDCPGGACKL
jgi:ribonucleoside-diphosphate reductase alpha chain